MSTTEMDPRLTPANGRVAAIGLKGKVEAEQFVEGERLQCVAPSADIRVCPDGGLASQLAYGETIRVFETRQGWSFGQSESDGYVGYVPENSLGPVSSPTHRVFRLKAHAYPEPSVKSIPARIFPFGSKLSAVSEEDSFVEVRGGGYVPRSQLLELDEFVSDFVSAAETFIGAPYLWGGKGPDGIDCSGLVQLALHSAGHSCPRDSDMQEAALGEPLSSRDGLARGDLIFWAGHVGIMADGDTLLHANASHMAVVKENFRLAESRIKANENLQIRAIQRL